MEGLPEKIREVAREKFKLLRENPNYPHHPSLRIKPMKGYADVWEGHVTSGYVFTFKIIKVDDEIIYEFRKIGKHDIYKNP